MNEIEWETWKRIKKQSDANHEKTSTFLRHLTLLFSSLLGILISFYKYDENSHVWFVLSVASIALGVLLALVSLYGEILGYHRLVALRKQSLAQKDYESLQQVISSRTPRIFYTSEKVSYASFSLGLILLVVYIAMPLK